MASDINKSRMGEYVINPLTGVTFIAFVMYLFLLNGSFNALARPYAPPGQTLYVLSKAAAIFVYLLMWWQIMLGVTKSINTKHHTILGISVLVLILSHIILFISAVSIRQGALSLGMLLPDFTTGYYASGISLGVLALFLILVASVSGVLRKKVPKHWKIGHNLVYITFTLATLHGLMIGSDVNSGMFSYIIYGAIFSLISVFIFQKVIKATN